MEEKVKSDEVRILWLVVIVHTIILYCICDFDKALETYKDELIYFNLAKCLADGRDFTMHGMELNFTNIAYPLLISPFLRIKDVVLRIHLITLLNAFLMSLSIVPVWLSCKELQVGKKIRWLIIGIIMIYPSMGMAATIMTENLYWPLTLFTFYFTLRHIKYGKISDAFAVGGLGFLCYFCKEVGVCLFLSVMAWFFISPVDSYLFDYKHSENDKEHFIKYYIKHFEWKNFCAYVFIYMMIYVIINKFLLSSVTNNYTGVSGSVSSLARNMDLSKVLYMAYAVMLYIVYSLIAFLVIPVICPILNLREMGNVTRKMYFYGLILWIGTILTIVCTISLKEDFGKVIPRVHMRYFSSIIGLMLPVYGSVLSKEKQEYVNKKIWALLGLFWVFASFIFKGAVRGSAVDSPELGYAVWLYNKYGVMDIGALKVYIVGIMCSIFLVAVIVIGYFIGKRKKKYTYCFFYVIAVWTCVLNFQKSFEVIKGGYSVPEFYIQDMKEINQYFTDNGLEDKNVLLVCKSAFSKTAKVYDTYFIGRQTYEIADASFWDMLNSTNGCSVSDCVFVNPLQGEFLLDQVDYFICDAKGFQSLVGNIEYLEEIPSETYSVYRNVNPSEISYLSASGFIDFTGSGYSLLRSYNIDGISIPEGTFSWTDGTELSMSCNLSEEISQVRLQINVTGTYNGVQNFTVYQNDLEVSQGSMSGSGQIAVDLAVENGNCNFRIALPDAVSPYALGMSEDKRVLALAISSMEFITEE